MIYQLLELLSLVVFLDTVLSYFPQVRSQRWAYELHKKVDVLLQPIRQRLPMGMAIDPSPMILIIIIQVLKMIIS